MNDFSLIKLRTKQIAGPTDTITASCLISTTYKVMDGRLMWLSLSSVNKDLEVM